MDHNDAAVMATELMHQHLAGQGWVGRWNESLTQNGSCHYGPKIIYLSAPFVANNSADEVRQTILHEIAHALVGPGNGHGRVWKARAAAIGYTGRTRSPNSASLDMFPIIGTCQKCGKQYGRQRMTANMRAGVLGCGVDMGRLVWKRVR